MQVCSTKLEVTMTTTEGCGCWSLQIGSIVDHIVMEVQHGIAIGEIALEGLEIMNVSIVIILANITHFSVR